MKTARPSAFTLIELLVVVAIIALLLAFVVPEVTSVLGGTNLTRASQMVSDQLNLARQTAISLNHRVEVRFYKYHDPTTSGTNSGFCAFQAWEMNSADSYTPLQSVQVLPTNVIMDQGTQNVATTLSSILGPDQAILGPPGPAALPRVATQYSYVAIHFTPNGGTDLSPTGGPAGTWFITLHSSLKGDALTTPPPDFVTIQVDPVGGTLKLLRPGAIGS